MYIKPIHIYIYIYVYIYIYIEIYIEMVGNRLGNLCAMSHAGQQLRQWVVRHIRERELEDGVLYTDILGMIWPIAISLTISAILASNLSLALPP